ncbi:PREDICTED: EF-hand calcium-binding domain-containing protein 11-like [Acropora digitifera]|uniref:EF-hand calcium-binding domain-containing protein 11-like n=1 Tax=Acropora digitifera TaxID=70779 RepID=UPI00077B0978|nr:PREDICTED: EF-hand calcium-binding domain-containing protein 11-like [Acropora digitifera]
MQNFTYRTPTFKNSRKITEEKMCQIAEAFHNADEGKKGLLTREDLKVAFVSLFGYKPSRSEVDRLMAIRTQQETPFDQSATRKSCIVSCETSPQVGITIEHFLEIAKTKILTEDCDDEIRQIFLAFDTRCQGFITLDVAKKNFLQVAPFLDPVTVEKLFQEADTDRDGRVSYRDFEFIMKYSMDYEL